MARYVIDAPTLLHLVAEDVDVSSAHQLVAPNLIRSQALSLLLAAVRAGEITEVVALQRHERVTQIKLRLLGDRVSRRTAWRIDMDRWPAGLRRGHVIDASFSRFTRNESDAKKGRMDAAASETPSR